jgi:hypothetical protein
MMYQWFKDFAGPIATIVAAIAAVCVTGYFAWRQTQIAKEQADIAKQNLRHDVFERQYERRYRVFVAVRKFLCEIGTRRIASDEDLRAYVIGTGDAVFLFDDDFANQLKEMHDRALKLRTLEEMKDTFVVGDINRNSCIAQSSEHFMWLNHQLEGLVDMFKPFLKHEMNEVSVKESNEGGVMRVMRPILISLALIAETGLIIATAYVFYRWRLENAWPGIPINPPNPTYWGGFETIVAPWIFSSLFIPACFGVMATARRFIRF